MSTLPDALVVNGTASIPHVASGTEIACKGGEPRAKVPAGVAAAGGYEVGKGVSGRWSGGGATASLRFSRSSDGTVTVTCSRK